MAVSYGAIDPLPQSFTCEWSNMRVNYSMPIVAHVELHVEKKTLSCKHQVTDLLHKK